MAGFADRLDRLAAFYGPIGAPPADPFGFYVWDVLGTHATAGRRDAAMTALRRVPALTPDSMHKLARGRLEAIVRQCGPRTSERLAALEAGSAAFRRQPRFLERLRGPLRAAWLAARDLPHLGHAGALGLLMFTAGSHLVPVDAGMARLATRLGLVTDRGNARRLVRDARRVLDRALPGDLDQRRRAVILLRHHAEHTCVEGTPHCGVCPLADDCMEGLRLGS